MKKEWLKGTSRDQKSTPSSVSLEMRQSSHKLMICYRPTEANRSGSKRRDGSVRTSGLLKHRLLIHCPEARQKHADDSLLREAVKQHLVMKAAWEHYCITGKERMVRPLDRKS